MNRNVTVPTGKSRTNESLRRRTPDDRQTCLRTRLARAQGPSFALDLGRLALTSGIGGYLATESEVPPRQAHIEAHDPIQAADDGLREFPANLVVFVTESDSGKSDELADAARDRYGRPIAQILSGR